jgi:hypothetical protein
MKIVFGPKNTKYFIPNTSQRWMMVLSVFSFASIFITNGSQLVTDL